MKRSNFISVDTFFKFHCENPKGYIESTVNGRNIVAIPEGDKVTLFYSRDLRGNLHFICESELGYNSVYDMMANLATSLRGKTHEY